MTEADWNACTDPRAMLDFLQDAGRLSERKARLFAVAVCRRLWPLLTEVRSRRAVEVTEQYADGEVDSEQLALCRNEVGAVWQDLLGASKVNDPAIVAAEAVSRAADEDLLDLCGLADAAVLAAAGRRAIVTRDVSATSAEFQRQANLLHDLVGNPLHPPPPLPAAWLSHSVLDAAQAAYDDRQLPEGTLKPGRLAALADALEEAGCTDASLLGHLHGPGLHWRGCWALDAVLGKA